jgi:glucokinase
MTRTSIIGIDLGGTNLKIGLSDSSCKIISKQVFSTTSFGRKESLIQAVTDSVGVILRVNRIPRTAVLGIGFGLPGPVDSAKGIVHFFPNIPGWREVNLGQILRKRLGFPVFIDNDANLMALAEARRGAAKGAANAVCITLGTGVGGGLILEGRLYRGSTYAAGEAGHIPISEDGPDCGCGSHGCLESYIGNRRILARARAVFGGGISLEELSRKARRGVPAAAKIWSDAGVKLGIALAGVVNLLNPDVIVIGGGVANAGAPLFDIVRKTIARRAMPMQARHVRIRRAALADPGIIGACLLVKEETGTLRKGTG